MSFSSLIGQPLAVELAQKWLAQNTNHPLLFFGPEGVGKKTLALELAKILNCNGQWAMGNAVTTNTHCPLPIAGVDPCVSCHKISIANHPDVRVVDFAWQALIRDEELEKQQNLKIETILAERHRLLQSPLEGRRKVLILDDAHRLTPDAANAFLKILEEPPADAVIILVTPFRDRLLPTTLSRCRPVRFRALTDQEMQVWQKRAGAPELDVWLTRGSPGRALHLIRDEALARIREAENLWDSLPQRSAVELVSNTEGRARGARMTRPDIEEKIKTLMVPAARALRSGHPARAARALPLMEDALQRLRNNVQPGLVYEDLLITLAKDA